MKRYHTFGISFAEPIKPVNTSGRSKAQIVFDAEASWLKHNLLNIDGHWENCRCMTCWEKFWRNLNDSSNPS